MERMRIQPILREVSTELHGDRVILRRPEAGDGPRLHEAVLESLAELRAWPASIPWALHEPSVESSETFCRRSCAEFIRRIRLPYLVADARSSSIIGCMGVTLVDWDIPRFELGFWCRRSAHGKGFMTESLKTLTAYLLREQGARRIECFTDRENHRARAVCGRAGMTHEATLRNERITPAGELRHTVIYSITD